MYENTKYENSRPKPCEPLKIILFLFRPKPCFPNFRPKLWFLKRALPKISQQPLDFTKLTEQTGVETCE